MLTERRNAAVLMRSRSLFMRKWTACVENPGLRFFVCPVHQKLACNYIRESFCIRRPRVIAEQRPGPRPIVNLRGAPPETNDQVLARKSWSALLLPWECVQVPCSGWDLSVQKPRF